MPLPSLFTRAFASSGGRKPRFSAHVLTSLALLLISASLLYRSPWSASALEIVNDSVEYAIGAYRLVTLGDYSVAINSAVYPPRYAFWFSAVALAPFYLLFPGSIGNGIFGVLLFALLGLLAAYGIGNRLGGIWAGAAAGIVLLTFKDYLLLGRMILTDVPATALGLAGGWLYLTMRTRPRLRHYILAGFVTALAFGFRYDMLGLCLPFLVLALRGKERRLLHIAALILPIILVLAANAVYDQLAFGDWRRNGYQFWSAVPYDYPNMVWSLSYLKINLTEFFAKRVILYLLLGVVGIALLWRSRSPELKPTLLYLALAAGPASVAHLFYVWTGVRFFLLGLSLVCILIGAGLATLIPERVRRLTWLPAALLLLGLALVPFARHRVDLAQVIPPYRAVADAIASITPPDAVILTGINPVYMTFMVGRNGERTIIPLARAVPYANLVLVRKRIPHPVPPPVLFHPRTPGMYRGGARDLILYTADERPDLLQALMRAGRPVYLDLSFMPVTFPLDRMRQQFTLVPVPHYPWLLRLEPAPQHPRSAPRSSAALPQSSPRLRRQSASASVSGTAARRRTSSVSPRPA